MKNHLNPALVSLTLILMSQSAFGLPKFDWFWGGKSAAPATEKPAAPAAETPPAAAPAPVPTAFQAAPNAAPIEDMTGVPLNLPPMVSEYPQPNKLVVVGDVHGDGEALQYILRQNLLIDANNSWIGGDTWLVVVGDMLDRGDNSRLALDILMKIEKQAAGTGGKVIVLMGNHEFLVIAKDLRYFSHTDALNYKAANLDERAGVVNAFSANSKYGRWLMGLPAMVKIGRTLFAHAGIDYWAELHSLQEINQMVRNWVLFYAGQGAEPPKETEWVIGDYGPFWTRGIALEEVPANAYYSWLAALGADQMVVGHTIVEKAVGPEAVGKYRGRLIKIDTAISRALGGYLSNLILTKNGDDVRFESLVLPRPAELGITKDTVFHPDEGIDYVPEGVPSWAKGFGFL